MFMLSLGDKNDGKRETEQLVIFGPCRARRGAELKILSAKMLLWLIWQHFTDFQ